jgi:hypothetical protein
MTKADGAEWEEVEFAVTDDAEPAVQVANISGDVFLVGQPVKPIIQNPKLFGTFKMGDLVPFSPMLTTVIRPRCISGIRPHMATAQG